MYNVANGEHPRVAGERKNCWNLTDTRPVCTELLHTETGSRTPSISTGRVAMNAIINTKVAVKNVRIIKTPNQLMEKQFSVLKYTV